MSRGLSPQQPMLRVERIGLALGLALAVFLIWPVRNHLVDPVFVHLQYARHLAEGRGPVFNPGERVYGCTSPLWAAIIADAMMLGANGLLIARLLGLLSTLVTIPLFLQLMRRTVRLPSLRAFATVTWAANAWMIQWSASGLETPLAVALTLAGFVAFTEGKQWGSRPVRTGSLWALAALTRPEAVVLIVLWVMTLLLDANGRTGMRRLLYGALPPVVIYGGWLLFARVYFGTFWPRTLASPGFAPRAFELPRLFDHITLVAQTEGVLLLMLFAALAFGGRALWQRPPNAQGLLPWLWVIAMPALYVSHGIPARSRYLLVMMPVLAWLSWRAADEWWLGSEPDSRPRRTQGMVFAFAIMVLTVAINFGVYRTQVVPRVERSTAAMRAGLIPWGSWFANHSTPDATIATPEVGAIGYYSGRRVLDLNGVISPDYRAAAAAGDPIAKLATPAAGRPQYLVERSPRPFSLLTSSRFAAALTPLGRAPAVPADDRVDSVYTFYRIDWSAFDRIRAAR